MHKFIIILRNILLKKYKVYDASNAPRSSQIETETWRANSENICLGKDLLKTAVYQKSLPTQTCFHCLRVKLPLLFANYEAHRRRDATKVS